MQHNFTDKVQTYLYF